MPGTDKQRVVAAIALHHPGKLYKRNQGMLSMTRQELHDFATKYKKGVEKAGKK